jgi:hypothetical protein
MSYSFAGLISLSSRFPCFTIPIFKHWGNEGIFAQQLTTAGLVAAMATIRPVDLHGYQRYGVQAQTENVSVGSDGVFAFSLTETDHVVGPYQALAARLELELGQRQFRPVAGLSIIRFLNKVELEAEAIRRVGMTIDNLLVRSRFTSMELAAASQLTDNKFAADLVGELQRSGSFATTHAAISKMMRARDVLVGEYIESALRACLTNNQVYWIGKDEDVSSFVQFLLQRRDFLLSEEDIASILQNFDVAF